MTEDSRLHQDEAVETAEQTDSAATPTFNKTLLTPSLKISPPEEAQFHNPFPIDRMPHTTAHCLRYLASSSGLNDAMLVGPLLTAISCALIPQVKVETFYNKVTGTNIYCQTNAPASSRKSDMYNPFKAYINELESQRRESIVEQNRKITAKHKSWELKLSAMKKRYGIAQKNNDEQTAADILEQIEALMLEEPNCISDLRILQGDVTPAAIIQRLEENGGYLSFFIDEGALLYNKIINNEVHHINSAWSGVSIDKTTVRDGNIFVREPRLTSHTFIQPEVFRKSFSGKSFSLLNDTGYFSRLLICEPNPSANKNVLPDFIGSKDIFDKLLDNFRKQLIRSYPFHAPFSGEQSVLQLSDEARSLAIAYYNTIIKESSIGGMYRDMPSFIGKLTEQVHRISAIISFIENPESKIIDATCVSAAIHIAVWYADEHWRIIVKGSKPIPVEVGAEKLIHFMRFRKDRHLVRGITYTQLRQRVECFRDNPDFLDDCIAYLEQLGEIWVRGHRRRGRRGGFRRYEVELSAKFEGEERYMGPKWSPNP